MAPDKPKRKPIDWEAVEREYRAGQLSIRQIAKMYKCSPAAIVKRAAQYGWTRNLTAAVRAETERRMVEVNAGVNTVNAREVIEAAAERSVSVVIGHREHIQTLRKTVILLGEQLQRAAEDRDQITGDIMEEVDGEPPDRRAAMLRAVALPTHARAAVDLSQTLAKLIPLERQAFNISGAVEKPESPQYDLTRLSKEELDMLNSLSNKIG